MSRPHRASSCCHILHLRVRFKFLHENKPETGSDAHTRAVKLKGFYLWNFQISFLWFRTTLLIYWRFFFSQQPHKNNQILDTYCVSALSSKMSEIPNRRPQTVGERRVIRRPSLKGNSQTASCFCNTWLDTSAVEIWQAGKSRMLSTKGRNGVKCTHSGPFRY